MHRSSKWLKKYTMEILRRNTTKARRGKRFFTIVKVISWCKQAAGQKRVDVVHLSDSPNNCVVLARPRPPPLSTAYKKPRKGSLADLGEGGVAWDLCQANDISCAVDNLPSGWITRSHVDIRLRVRSDGNLTVKSCFHCFFKLPTPVRTLVSGKKSFKHCPSGVRASDASEKW